MRSLFNSRIRLVRADYSGDGRGTTRDGQLVDIYDFLGVQSKGDDPAQDFEAAWSPEGAVCVRVTRLKLKGRIGTICTEEFARAAVAVLFNRSPP
jgi:hypothetical protein